MSWNKVYETEILKDGTIKDPVFNEFTISALNLTNYDPNRNIRIELIKVSDDVESKVDELTLSVSKIQKGKMIYNFNKNFSMTLKVNKFVEVPVPTWFDYIKNGLNINLVVGID